MEKYVILVASHLTDYYHAIYKMVYCRLMMHQSINWTNAWFVVTWTLLGKIQWNCTIKAYIFYQVHTCHTKCHLTFVNEKSLSRPVHGNNTHRIFSCHLWHYMNELALLPVCDIFMLYTWVDWWSCCSHNMVLTWSILGFFPESWTE